MINKMVFYLIIFVVFLTLFSFYGFWQATHPPKFITDLTPKDLGWEYEEVTLTTEDDIKLAAWFVPSTTKTDKVIILLHGYPADKANLLQWASFLHQDFNLFFLDFRYFGKSEGTMTTIGFHEQKDLEAAIDYLKNRDFEKIGGPSNGPATFDVGAMGFSLGGAVAILTASKDSGLKAIVSDSAFANLDLMAYEFYRPLFILKYPLTFLTKLWAQIFIGINADEISPEKAAQNFQPKAGPPLAENIPILLIHSQKDQTIAFENAQRIQTALKDNPKAEFLFLEEGTHGYLPVKIQEEYQKKVLEFFKDNLE